MKNISLFILLYNFISLHLLDFAWIYEEVTVFGFTEKRCVFINYLDMPFYGIFLFVFFKWGYKLWNGNHSYLNRLQIYCTFGCIAFLSMIAINSWCECITVYNIKFWGKFIVVATIVFYLTDKYYLNDNKKDLRL